MQSLFEWDFNYVGDSGKKLGFIVEKNIQEFAPGLETPQFIKEIVSGVIKNKKKIDKIIEKAAPEWPLEQIAIVDRNVLRIGIYELLFGNRKEVPPKVAINEAIELAKTFGSDSSGKFVNGVLGTIYREIGEPGKEESGGTEKVKKDLKNIPSEDLGGAVVYRKENNFFLFALVHDVFGYWTLSKGHLEGDEDLKSGTLREIQEELGINAVLMDDLGKNEYIASDPEKGPVRRKVHYFLAETKDKNLKLAKTGGLDDVKWFKKEEMDKLKMYEDIKSIIAKAFQILEV